MSKQDHETVVSREIDRLHKELQEKGLPAKAKILKRFTLGLTQRTDYKYFFLVLEVDRGDGEPYIVKKYRPWLPDRCIEDKYGQRKPYYWHTAPCFFYSDIKEGAILPVRVHPAIPELIEFELHIDEGEIFLDPHRSEYPLAFEKWRRGEPDTSAVDIRPVEDDTDVVPLFAVATKIANTIQTIFGRRRPEDIALIERLQSEMKTGGVPATARVVSYRRDRSLEKSQGTYDYSPNAIYLDLEVQRPGQESYRVCKCRPWQPDGQDWWYVNKAARNLIEPAGIIPIIVHPRIPEIVDFESNINRTTALDPIDRGYKRSLFEKWRAEAEERGVLDRASS
jgi:hypothetical protein